MANQQEIASPRDPSWRMTRVVSFVVLMLIIMIVSALSYRVMRGFILPLFLAALLVVIFDPVHRWILARCRGRNSVAAGLTTAAILLVVLAPLGWAVTIGVKEGIALAHLADSHKLEKTMQGIRESLHLNIPFESEVEEIDGLIESLRLNDGDGNSSDPDLSRAIQIIRANKPRILRLRTSVTDFSQLLDSAAAALDGGEGPIDDTDMRDRTKTAIAAAGSNPFLLARITAAKAPLGNMIERPDDRRLLDELVQLSGNIDPQSATRREIVAYQNIVDELGDHFRAMRIGLLGGVLQATLAQVANPTKSQIRDTKLQVTETLRRWLFTLTGQTSSLMGSIFLQLFILAVAIFYFLIDGPQMVSAAIAMSPMEDHYEQEMIAEFAKLSRAVVLATLLSALAQGALAGMGYFAVWGFSSLFVLVILTTLLAMVPFVGAAAVWIPVCLFVAFVEGRYLAAGMLALWGFFVVSMADNLIKPYVLKGQSNLHPLFALLSVIGGVQALGPIGVLVGPMVVAFLQSLMNILRRVLNRLDERRLQPIAIK